MAKERFLREGYAANQVGHPGAVRVLDDDVTDDSAVFLVMELLEGQTVDARAEAHPGSRLPLEEVLAIADQTLDVLAAAHDKGIVHRDLKPDNLFLTAKGEIRVLDFGIARVRELQTSAAVATQTGAAMGTPAFMPPEQASGQWSQVDARTDLWALGATMFLLLTGRLVHEGATVQLMLAAAMTKPAPPIKSIEPGVPRAVAALVDRAVAFERDERWPDARAMQRAVRAARSGAPFSFAPLPLAAGFDATLIASNATTSPVSTGATPAKRAARPGRALVVAGAAAGAGVALALAAWFVSHHAGGPAPSASTPADQGPSGAPVATAAQPPPSVPTPIVSPTATADEARSAVPLPTAGEPVASSASAPPAQALPRGPAAPAQPAGPRTKASSSPAAPKHPGIY
jgi:serine/threonine-protein kinase